jgi:hypothetical protein
VFANRSPLVRRRPPDESRDTIAAAASSGVVTAERDLVAFDEVRSVLLG